MGLVVGTLALVGIITLVAHHFSPRAMLRRQIGEQRAWPIAQLPGDTDGKIIGQVRVLHGERGVLAAPITGRPCVYYIVEVLENRGKSTYTIVREEIGVPFELVDATGRAIVDPRGAKVVLVADAMTSSGMLDDASSVEEAFLRRHGESSTSGWFNRSLGYRESVIEPGEYVAVLGAGVREPDPNAAPAQGYREGAPTRLRLSGSPRHPLLISDDPRTMRR